MSTHVHHTNALDKHYSNVITKYKKNHKRMHLITHL
nr:MAG TPA: hypothetical protein [Siphoviridae sp. ctcOR4]